jgi:hypothetical protein
MNTAKSEFAHDVNTAKYEHGGNPMSDANS